MPEKKPAPPKKKQPSKKTPPPVRRPPTKAIKTPSDEQPPRPQEHPLTTRSLFEKGATDPEAERLWFEKYGTPPEEVLESRGKNKKLPGRPESESRIIRETRVALRGRRSERAAFDTEDVANVTMLKLWRWMKKGTYRRDEEKPFPAVVKKVAKRTARDMARGVRDAMHHPAGVDPSDPIIADRLPGPTSHPTGDMVARLQQALAALTERERGSVIRRAAGESVESIARSYGVEARTIRRDLVNARVKLRRALEG